MKLQAALQDTSDAVLATENIQDPAVRDAIIALARIVDTLVVNQRSMAGENIGNQRGNIDEDVRVLSIADLLTANVIKEYIRSDLSNLLTDEGPRRYISTTYGESKKGSSTKGRNR